MYTLLIGLLLFSLIHYGDLTMTAGVTLYTDNMSGDGGSLEISQNNDTAQVSITGKVVGLAANTTHGFHVHEFPVSELFPNCTSAGGHFNPYNVSHGPPSGNITTRHVGDLGNLTTNINGSVNVNITDSIISLYNSTRLIINRTFVVHAMFDDGGTGANDSNVTGNAGARVFCGLIRLVSNTSSTTTSTTTTSTTEPKPSMAIAHNSWTQWILLLTAIVTYVFSHYNF